MKKFIVISIILAALSSQYVSSQQADHEFSAYGGMGLSTLNYKLSLGARNGGAGGIFGAGYTYFRGRERVSGTGRVVREDWGIHTGLELGLYNAKSKITGEIVSKGRTDSEGDLFDLHTRLFGYRETQTMMLLNIPMMAQFTMDRYYVLGGFKLGVPLMGRFKSKDAALKNEAYYEKYENWFKEELFSEGFGSYTINNKGKMKYGATAMLSMEAGVKWILRRKLSLYSGLYFDYGLNNIAKNSQKIFVNYNPDNPSGFTPNSVLSVYTEKVKVMAVGVKVRMAMIM